MRVTIRSKSSAGQSVWIGTPGADYPLRGSSFVLSVAAHCLGIAGLALMTFPHPEPQRPLYDQFIKPHEHEILYYDFRKKVPDVSPAQRVGEAPRPRGAELAERTILASSPKPKSRQVFISVRAPKIEIQHDLPAPLLVEKLNTALPSLPPPPTPPAPRRFVPPRPLDRQPKLPIQAPVVDSQAPPIALSAVSSPLLTAPLTLPKVAGPAPRAPVAPAAHPGNATADVAVASLHPSDRADKPVPNGVRPAQFSKAPTQGAPASGDANPTATLTVPDLTIRQARPKPPSPTRSTELLYTERVRVPMSTLSVPLRPANRMVPPAVEARFQGRSVYAIVIPMEHLPSYKGDWIMWFADRESKPGDTPVVRAPIPFRKLEPVDQPPTASRPGERIQLAATLDRQGKLDGITLLTKTTPEVQRAVFEDVTSWQFQPAVRDGVPVDVDVVLEIPFNMATILARSAP